jgi:hypothetical protein
MHRSITTILAICMTCLLYGCANLSTPGPGLTVDVPNSFTAIQAATPAVTLTAVVANDPHKHGVKWSLTLANAPCSPGCGKLVASGSPSFSAVYTPPTTAPLNQSATITALAVDSDRIFFAFDFTITPLVSVSITDKFTTVVAGGAALPLMANVQFDSANGGVTWTLTAGGTNCSPACGTISAPPAPTVTATYTPPLVQPTGANDTPTITATSVSNSSSSDSFTFTINSALALFKGSYAFLMRGYDTTGSPMAMVGSITADGSGNISGGELDFNNGGGVTSVASPLAGNYLVDTSFNQVLHVTATITNYTFPASTNNIVLKFVVSADGMRGKILELDGSGFLNSGTILAQDSAAVAAANPSGNYVFGLDSDAPVGGRTVAAGQFVLGAAGVTSGIIDESKAGDATPRYAGAAITGGGFTKPDAVGRGTVTFTVNGTNFDYAYYVVNANQLYLLETDPGVTFGTVQAGVAQIQKTLTAASVNATSVMQMTGMDSPSGTTTIGPAVFIGVMQIAAGNAFTLTFDSNDVGTVLTSHPAGGTITFDPSTGRGVLADPGGFQNGFLDDAVFYLSDTGTGFIIDTDPSAPNGVPPAQAITNDAYSGTLTTQAAGPFNLQSVTGNLIAQFGGSAAPTTPNVTAAFNFDPTMGAYTAAGDLTSLPSQGANLPSITFSGTYQFFDPTFGHGIVNVPAPLLGDFTPVVGLTHKVSYYLVGPNQFVCVGIDTGVFSGVGVFDPE